MTTRRARANAVLEVELPTITDDINIECPICYHGFCSDDKCCRTQTNLECCDGEICCGCLFKLVRRCTCMDDCSQVITFCTYCRGLSPVTALDVLLGTREVCDLCLDAEDKEAAEDQDGTGGSNDTAAPDSDPEWHPTMETRT